MVRIVVKVSGKIVGPHRVDAIKALVEAVKRLREDGVKILALVVGGGELARSFIRAARELGVGRSQQDLLGIEAARLNARLVAYALGDIAYPEPPRSLHEALQAASTGKIVVAGGFQPGQSTAAVAALLAEALGADMLLLGTRVDGVYDKDPARHPDAKLIEKLSYDELVRVLEQSVEPGRYELLDPLAVSVLKRSGIPTRVFNAENPLNLVRAVKGEIGSLVTP